MNEQNIVVCVCVCVVLTKNCVYIDPAFVLQAEKDAKKKARAKELKKLKKAREKEEKEKEKEKAKVSTLSSFLNYQEYIQLHKSNLSLLLMSSRSMLGLLLFNVVGTMSLLPQMTSMLAGVCS